MRSISEKALMAIVVPPALGRETGTGTVPVVQILVDGSDSNTAALAIGYGNVVRRWSRGGRPRPAPTSWRPVDGAAARGPAAGLVQR